MPLRGNEKASTQDEESEESFRAPPAAHLHSDWCRRVDTGSCDATTLSSRCGETVPCCLLLGEDANSTPPGTRRFQVRQKIKLGKHELFKETPCGPTELRAKCTVHSVAVCGTG
ncbi:unnamed protein product [Prorocentrum cordatum]|uniref:Uncharacterized protein n=1 Tax=Prorocentrum cordatum TaxID=2364126 RepID=A0ABN9RF59_9DINO|nr:unnamed protein product [Polarella glacialis]